MNESGLNLKSNAPLQEGAALDNTNVSERAIMTDTSLSRENSPAFRELPDPVEAPNLDMNELAFLRCIARMEWLIDAETNALKEARAIDFDDLNARKTHALLEFSRMARAAPDRVNPEVAQRLKSLQAKLSENAQTLAHNLQALSEISRILISSIAAEDSDGTYSGRSAGAYRY